MNIEIRTSASHPQVAAGPVKGTVVGFEDAPKHDQYGESLLVTFSVTDGEIVETVRAYWNPVCSAKSNLGLLVAKANVEPKQNWGTAAFAKALIASTAEKAVTLEAYHSAIGGWTRVRHYRGA